MSSGSKLGKTLRKCDSASQVSIYAMSKGYNVISNGSSYSTSTRLKVECGSSYSDGQTASVTADGWSFLVPSNAPANKMQVKIGSNGIQVFLGNSFYFTAANRGTSSSPDPLIVMAGQVGSQMKTLKLDKTGFSQSGLF